jgi:hypothetical protein
MKDQEVDVLIHPLCQVLGTRRFLAGRAFEVGSFLDLNDLTQMYATKLVRTWGYSGPLHFGSSGRKDAPRYNR